MVTQTEHIRQELSELINEGLEILNSEVNPTGQKVQPDKQERVLQFRYENWYTTALRLVEQFAPNRVNDFLRSYKLEQRKRIIASTYTISDYLLGFKLPADEFALADQQSSLQIFAMKLRSQIGIVISLGKSLENILYDISGILQADLFDNELHSAEELIKSGHFRPAGVLAGVTLEGHLGTVCQNHKVKITKKHPTISTYNDALKDKSIYDIAQWRFIQHLADLRNKCAHKGTDEPTKQDAQDLIDGVKKVIKTVF